MKDNSFIDSNLFIYSYTDVSEEKQAKARKLIGQLPRVIISIQVLNEFVNTMLRKMKVSWEVITANLQEMIENTQVTPLSSQTVLFACQIAIKYKFSFYDSLIVAAALEAGCNILYTEDLQDGQVIENTLTVINPLK